MAREMCRCGHAKGLHLAGHITPEGKSFANGHGACSVQGCPCSQFTWVKVVKGLKCHT